MVARRFLRLSLLIGGIVLSAIVAPASLIPVHAAGNLYIDPVGQAVQPAGSIVTYQVKVANMDPFNAWDIRISTTRLSLDPVNVSLASNVLGNPFSEFVNCVNDGEGIPFGQPGDIGCNVQDGPGIVHSAADFLSSSPSATNGLLFTMKFRAGSQDYSQVRFLDSIIAGAGGEAVIHMSTEGSYGKLPGGIPTAEFSWRPVHPVAGDTISFNASLSHDDPSNSPSGLQSYQWDFGDSSLISSTTTPYVDHRFEAASGGGLIGNFTVTLTVTNELGLLGGTSMILEVKLPPSPCGSLRVFIQVPNDCPTIQSAINSIMHGGTIQVSSGLYGEFLQIYHPLTIRGAGQATTVLTGDVFSQAGNVSISGLTIQGKLDIGGGPDNTITNNTVEGGVILRNAPHTIFSDNIVGSLDGLTISSSPKSIVHRNILSNLDVEGNSVLEYVLAIDGSNMVQGKSVYYVTGAENPTIPAEVGYLGLINSSNVNIGPRSFPNVSQALLLVSTSGITAQGMSVATGSVDILDSTKVVIENGAFQHSHFRIANSTLTTIRNNRIASLELTNSEDNRIIGNNFSTGTSLPYLLLEGIFLGSSKENEVSKNTISGNYYTGIFLSDSASNRLDGNTVEYGTATQPNPFGYGVDLFNSPRNILTNNRLVGRIQDLSVRSEYIQCYITGGPCALVEDYVQNIDTTNTVEGQPVYYLVNTQNMMIPSDAGYIAIIKSGNIQVQNVNLSSSRLLVISSSDVIVQNADTTRTALGVLVWLSHDVTIKDSKLSSEIYALEVVDSYNILVTGNRVESAPYPSQLVSAGILLTNSTFSRIVGNFISGYSPLGIGIGNSSNNIINRNTLVGLQYANTVGIRVGRAGRDGKPDNNLVIENTIANNWVGLDLSDSAGNTIYENNIVNDLNPAYGSNNTWDNGAGHGNYWSDYRGMDLDNDGVGDTLVPHHGLDKHPLMKPWTPTGLAGSFTGRGAWFVQVHSDNSDGRHSDQSLLARVRNNGQASEWVDIVYSITSSSGSTVTIDVGPVWLSKGQSATLSIPFQGSPGDYTVKAELRFSSDAFLGWTNATTKSFVFKVNDEKIS